MVNGPRPKFFLVLAFHLFILEDEWRAILEMVMYGSYRLHWVEHSLRSLYLVTDISDDLDVGQRIDAAAVCPRQRPKGQV